MNHASLEKSLKINLVIPELPRTSQGFLNRGKDTLLLFQGPLIKHSKYDSFHGTSVFLDTAANAPLIIPLSDLEAFLAGHQIQTFIQDLLSTL